MFGRKHSGVQAFVGLALVVAAPFAYAALVNDVVAARTGWPLFAAVIVGLALATIAAVRDARLRTRVAAALALAGALGWTAMFFVALRTPGVAPLATAPDVTLVGPDGAPVSLAVERAKGPVLLVFYRGWW